MKSKTLLTCGLIASTAYLQAQIDNLDEKVAAALPMIQAYAEQTLESTGVPAIALTVVYKDEVVLQLPLGVKVAGTDDAVDADTRFQIASLSKPMTSTLASVAVDKEYIDWNAPLVEYDPGFLMYSLSSSSLVSVADSLSHRTGLPGHGGDKLEDLGYSRHDILVRNRLLPNEYTFREGYAYTNFAFTEGGVATARAVGMDFDDMADSLLFEPLGMERTSYRFADFIEDANHASIHVQTAPGVWEPLYTRDPDAQAPAGGLSTTLNDYAHWMSMQLAEGSYEGEPIVDSEVLAYTWQPQAQTGYNAETHTASYYGLGWNLANQGDRGLFLNHSGAFDLGVRSGVGLYPNLDLGIAIFVNAGGNGIPEGLMFAFYDYVFEGELTRDWVEFANEYWIIETEASWGYGGDYTNPPENPVPAKANSAYVGEFTNSYWGDLEVVENDGELAFNIGPHEGLMSLTHWDGDVFLFQPVGEMGGPLSKFTFVFNDGDTSAAASVDLEYYAVDRDGVFTRAESWLDQEGWAQLFAFSSIYVLPAPTVTEPAAWLWMQRPDWQGWAWTSESTYPWLYDSDAAAWVYFGDITVDRAESGDAVYYWFYDSSVANWTVLSDSYPHINQYGLSDAAAIEYVTKPFGLEPEWPRYTAEAIEMVTPLE